MRWDEIVYAATAGHDIQQRIDSRNGPSNDSHHSTSSTARSIEQRTVFGTPRSMRHRFVPITKLLRNRPNISNSTITHGTKTESVHSYRKCHVGLNMHAECISAPRCTNRRAKVAG
jgi:hypothetical protein